MIARRTLYALSFAVVLAGYGLVVQPAERSIREVQSHARQLYDEANENDVKIRRSAELQLAARRVKADVARLAGRPDATTASAIRLLNVEAQRFHLRVSTVSPDAGAPAPSPDAGGFQSIVWNVGLRGQFRNVVALIADLSKHDVLVEINDASLSTVSQQPGSDGARKSPDLDVIVRTVIYSPAAAFFSEVNSASYAAR